MFANNDGKVEKRDFNNCSPMDFTGRPMKDFVYIFSDALKTKRKSEFWINQLLNIIKLKRNQKIKSDCGST